MRLLFILVFVSCFSFSQTNEVLVNQAVQTAKSQNITTKSQAVKALEARGITENQARQLASQRGLSYDQLLNEYFKEDGNTDNTSESSPDTSILEEATTNDGNESSVSESSESLSDNSSSSNKSPT